MQSSYKGKNNFLIAALTASLLSSAIALCATTAGAEPLGVNRLLIAQADDGPPELNNFRPRAKRFGLQAEDSNASYGERPFRRPREQSDNAGGAQGDPAVAPRRRPFAGAILPVDGNQQRPVDGGLPFPGAGRPNAARFGQQGMPEGPRRLKREAGKIQTSGGLFGSRKPLDFSILQLSDEQKNRIREIRRQNAGPVRGMQKSLRDGRTAMRDLMFDPAASDEQIRSKRREIHQIQDRVEEAQINDFLSIRHVLTADQRQRLPDLKPGGPEDPPAADGGPPR